MRSMRGFSCTIEAHPLGDGWRGCDGAPRRRIHRTVSDSPSGFTVGGSVGVTVSCRVTGTQRSGAVQARGERAGGIRFEPEGRDNRFEAGEAAGGVVVAVTAPAAAPGGGR